MELSHGTVQGIVTRLMDDGTVYDHAGEYGEPGYSFDNDETPIFLIGHWWCRCGKNPHAGKRKPWAYDREEFYLPTDLHSINEHHPRLWAQLESQGVETAFDDEWTVIDGKAYRTQPDSYSWQSSIQYDDESGEYLTPDDDIEDWIAWAVNDHQRCLMSDYRSDLRDAGYVQWEPDDPHRYESGWHPGQTDDPKVVTDEIRETLPDDDIVFVLDETSQFYVGFSAWTRPVED